jgi:cellobiose phosphorylase
VTYHIDVKRAGPGNAVALTVNGHALAGNVVPAPAADQREVKVEVVVS